MINEQAANIVMKLSLTKLCRVSLATLPLLLLLACSTQAPVPIQERSVDIEQEIRQPAVVEGAGLQVRPLQNPGVRELVSQAEQAEQNGDLNQASIFLERALRIQPRDPELLQSIAEIKLQQESYEQALNYASRSYDVGPKVGELCSRNWRTISVSREFLDDYAGSEEARQRAAGCALRKPETF